MDICFYLWFSYKTFQFKSDDGTTHKVVLKHHTVTGELDILLDGKFII